MKKSIVLSLILILTTFSLCGCMKNSEKTM